jgi:hypothetical protein
MAGHALALVADYTALLVPAAESMQHHNSVPDGALGNDSRHIRNREQQFRNLFCDEGFDGDRLVGIPGPTLRPLRFLQPGEHTLPDE